MTGRGVLQKLSFRFKSAARQGEYPMWQISCFETRAFELTFTWLVKLEALRAREFYRRGSMCTFAENYTSRLQQIYVGSFFRRQLVEIWSSQMQTELRELARRN